ncbi:MAG TPA: tRNA (guanosine(46)-N7)-methyltransferase TrmB, partial [Bacillota bacterium]|nr:tRNA (guanosine(46)-N7)-methyltransferase TrmB [Bacillota bacterium]
RKVKNEAIRLAAVEYLQIKNGQEILGRWRDFLKEKNHDFTGGIFLEIGCGRGHFLASMGEANPNHFYLGAEGRSSVVLKAMELIQEKELANVLFIPEFILDIESYFAEGELTGIYLNFSDPWPKKRHTKRRLTNRKYLAGYRHVLAPGGFIEFKTDSDEFFDFTLEECSEAGLTVEESTRDLHNTDLPARLVTTQYEELFRSLGKPIHYCRIRV